MRFGVGSACALMIAVFGAACGDDNGIGPESLRFGLSGGITIQLETPLGVEVGTLIAPGMQLITTIK
jgi:hypothetical protein